MNGNTYAYIGDAYYELKVRESLIKKGLTKTNDLHQKAIEFTCCQNQAKIINHLIDLKYISLKEMEIVKNGRNASNLRRKVTSTADYRQATGFEALIGRLYLEDVSRCNMIVEKAILLIEEWRQYGNKEKE